MKSHMSSSPEKWNCISVELPLWSKTLPSVGCMKGAVIVMPK